MTRIPIPRRGVSLVEVLVVMGVTSLLLGLLLPAVQSLREAARSTQCRDRLRALGLAAQAHHATHAALPRTSFNPPVKPGDPANDSPHRQLLPFLDLQTVVDRIAHPDWGRPKHGMRLDPYLPPENLPLLHLTIPVFLCPSDTIRPGATNFRGCEGAGANVFRHTMLPCGEDPFASSGLFVHDRAIRFAEIRDGTSHTVLFGERVLGDFDDEHYDPWRDTRFVVGPGFCTANDLLNHCEAGPTLEGQSHSSREGETWLYGSRGLTIYNHVGPPNGPVPDCAMGGSIMSGGGKGSYAARSAHSGGVNLGLADGSVRFVNDKLDLAIYRALATRASSEPVSENW